MAIKIVGAAASNNDDAMDKADVTAALNAADGTGLTDNGSGVLSIGANYRSIAIPFHIPGTVTTGIKTPEFIFPVACTLVDMRTRLSAGSGTTTVRPSKNGGSSDGSTNNVTTSSGNTAQNLSFAAGDRLQLNITAVGTTPTNLSVTFWANIT